LEGIEVVEILMAEPLVVVDNGYALQGETHKCREK
jgi:hypothetical protein